MKITLERLNEKWWYRFLKVIYIVLFAFFSILTVFIVFSDNSPEENIDYKIYCKSSYSNGSSFWANDEDIYLSGSIDDINKNLTAEQKNTIKERCDLTKEEMAKNLLDAKEYSHERILNGENPESVLNYVLLNYKPYYVFEELRIRGSYFAAIGYSLLVILGILLLAEIIRRVFYYIVLGKFFPEKK